MRNLDIENAVASRDVNWDSNIDALLGCNSSQEGANCQCGLEHSDALCDAKRQRWSRCYKLGYLSGVCVCVCVWKLGWWSKVEKVKGDECVQRRSVAMRDV